MAFYHHSDAIKLYQSRLLKTQVYSKIDNSTEILKNNIIYIGLPLYSSVFHLISSQIIFKYLEKNENTFSLILNTPLISGKTPENQYGINLYDLIMTLNFQYSSLNAGLIVDDMTLPYVNGKKKDRLALKSSKFFFTGEVKVSSIIKKKKNAYLRWKYMSFIKYDLMSELINHVQIRPQLLEKIFLRGSQLSASQALSYGIIDKILL